MEEIRVSSGALVGREDRVTGAGLVVNDMEEWKRYEHQHRGSEGKEKKQRGSVAGERNASDEGIEEGA